jgi:hypothetical protein
MTAFAKSSGLKKYIPVLDWRPAHDGPFSLQARLYWPKPEALDPLYVLPPVVKVNGSKKN